MHFFALEITWLNLFPSSCVTTSMREEKVRCPWSYCKIRNIVMLCPYDYTMIGIRRFLLLFPDLI